MNSNAQKAELKILFLGEFVKKLILANKPGLFETLEIEAKKQAKEAAEKAKKDVAEEIRKLQKKEQIIESPRISAFAPQAQPTGAAMKPSALLAPQPAAWNKLYAFINDPTIIAIECPGAGIPLNINRRGVIQKTPIILSEEEVKDLMKDLSQKTRIPLLSGIFKVAYQNLIITAFISEFVGTRFLIQKKAAFPPALPYQPLPYKPAPARF